MKLNIMLSDLLSLAKQENESNRCDHSEEYDKLYSELDRKTLIIDSLEKQLGCPLEVFMKLHNIEGLYCEIEIALSSFPSKTVYLEIDRLGLEGIHFKKNKYELYFIEYKFYKNCFWIKKDKSE